MEDKRSALKVFDSHQVFPSFPILSETQRLSSSTFISTSTTTAINEDIDRNSNNINDVSKQRQLQLEKDVLLIFDIIQNEKLMISKLIKAAKCVIEMRNDSSNDELSNIKYKLNETIIALHKNALFLQYSKKQQQQQPQQQQQQQ